MKDDKRGCVVKRERRVVPQENHNKIILHHLDNNIQFYHYNPSNNNGNKNTLNRIKL